MAKTMLRIQPLLMSLIGGILLILLGITGCSDSRLDSMLTVDDINRYTISNGGGAVCIQNGDDLSCKQLVAQASGGTAITSAPIIHIHPQKLIYVFYYEGRPILRAERAMDTTVIVEQFQDLGKSQTRPRSDYVGGTEDNNRNTRNTQNTGNTGGGSNTGGGGNKGGNPVSSDTPPINNGDTNGGNNGGNNGNTNGGNNGGNNGNNGNNGGNNGNNGDTNNPDTTNTPPEQETPQVPFTPGAIETHHVHPVDTTKKTGWIVWVNYPPEITEDSPDADKPGSTYETSLLTVKVTDGDQNIIEIDKPGWNLAGNWDGTYSAQFFVETHAEEITIHVTGIVYATRTATFRMTMVDGEMVVEDDAGTNTFQTAPLERTENE